MAPTIGSIVNFKIDEKRVRPMIVTQVFPDEHGPETYGVNGIVFLDGLNDLGHIQPLPVQFSPVASGVPLLFVYSVKQGNGLGEWDWPKKEKADKKQ